MDSTQPPTIAEAVAEIRRQLIAAQTASRADADKHKRIPFAVKDAEAELGVEVVRVGDEIRVGVLTVNGDAGEATHKVTVRFEPRSRSAGMVEISDDPDDDF